MRRAQTLRNYGRGSTQLGADDLGMLREDESVEDVLRRQLLEKQKECDKLQSQVQTLQAQLASRPPLDEVQALEKEYKNLELILLGTQRENERSMSEIESRKAREKLLEKELERAYGSNWQANLELGPSSVSASSASAIIGRAKAAAAPPPSAPTSEADTNATRAYLEQVRLAILGMEQRLQAREDVLAKHIERAETEGARYEEVRQQSLVATSN
ncbi:uncharacterized protein BXZ73DRAFT_46978 [Epithele typhae]|uniref:uncharacterized protein n=1 Tax=Epithele typhae TaxID=378194 RepID=UPI0020086FDC|nr:uncharacterized protein BXZ73DRAFT_46978 [Epithele typhae]KAH9932108.1 hypothetical protein BXZ73DRAFT_46978 [Epithele typhae]